MAGVRIITTTDRALRTSFSGRVAATAAHDAGLFYSSNLTLRGRLLNHASPFGDHKELHVFKNRVSHGKFFVRVCVESHSNRVRSGTRFRNMKPVTI
jgi:hypothetical protein